ncbi:MAG TPA: hypothetical protein VIZ64_05745, partial [Dokdonella sp.]
MSEVHDEANREEEARRAQAGGRQQGHGRAQDGREKGRHRQIGDRQGRVEAGGDARDRREEGGGEEVRREEENGDEEGSGQETRREEGCREIAQREEDQRAQVGSRESRLEEGTCEEGTGGEEGASEEGAGKHALRVGQDAERRAPYARPHRADAHRSSGRIRRFVRAQCRSGRARQAPCRRHDGAAGVGAATRAGRAQGGCAIRRCRTRAGAGIGEGSACARGCPHARRAGRQLAVFRRRSGGR